MKRFHAHLIVVIALVGVVFYLIHLLNAVSSLESLSKVNKANAQFLGCSQVTRGSAHGFCVYWSPNNKNISCPAGSTKYGAWNSGLCATGAEQPDGSCCLPNPTPTPTAAPGHTFCETWGGKCRIANCPNGYQETFGAQNVSCGATYGSRSICCMPVTQCQKSGGSCASAYACNLAGKRIVGGLGCSSGNYCCLPKPTPTPKPKPTSTPWYWRINKYF